MKDKLYQEAVGSLMYAMVAIRLDLAFAVSVISRFMSKPGSMYWMAVKRIMQLKVVRKLTSSFIQPYHYLHCM